MNIKNRGSRNRGMSLANKPKITLLKYQNYIKLKFSNFLRKPIKNQSSQHSRLSSQPQTYIIIHSRSSTQKEQFFSPKSLRSLKKKKTQLLNKKTWNTKTTNFENEKQKLNKSFFFLNKGHCWTTKQRREMAFSLTRRSLSFWTVNPEKEVTELCFFFGIVGKQ